MTARHPIPERRSRTAWDNYAVESLGRLARILVRCGHSPKDLVNVFREACRALREPAQRSDSAEFGFLADLPHVIALWHYDPRYLDPRGAPAPLPLRGGRRSLSSLIKSVLRDADPNEVTQALIQMQGLKRHGNRYVPTSRYLSYRRDHGRVYSLNALIRMLRTVEGNVSGARKAAIFERSAIHPFFPVAEVPAFHRHASSKGQDWLVDLDGYMQRRAQRRAGGPRTRIGVEIFVFEEPRRRNLPPKSKRRTASARPQKFPGSRKRRIP
jgi:hypothetical protein